MPLYDLACHHCYMTFEDVLLSLDEYEHPPCPACGQEARIVLRVGRVVGPTDTRPVHMESVGQTFTSSKQVADYERERGIAFVDHTDSAWVKQKDQSRERVEATSRRLGFSGWDERKRYLRNGGLPGDHKQA